VTDLSEYDAERIEISTDALGGPVDAPDAPRTIFADIVNEAEQPLRPIVPAWLRSPDQRRQAAKTGASLAIYHATYHATRAPKYAAKVAVWSPYGLLRGIGRLWHWTFDVEGFGIRQAAATRGDVADYLSLSRQRDRRVVNRLWFALPLVAAVIAAVVLLCTVAPIWARVVVLVAAVPVFAWYGRPADRPITDRVTLGQRFTKLTAEQVRTALISLGIPRIREAGDLTFPPPGIHRDGPGFMARVNLPAGVEVTEVLERRGRLSSALRLPVDQVWPAAGTEHAGQLDLWVGIMPASKMGQPRWSLAADTARTSVFDEHEFGTDQRQRPIRTPLFARNFLLGGVPGSGKSYGARALAMIAVLDPTCELKIAEFKGTGDFGDLAPLCSSYVCGVDDQAMAEGASIIAWGLAEAERRGKRIRAARERGEAPEGKVTPELAAKAGSGLHPVLILIDEAHELLCDKDVAADAERLIKRGRALGLIVVLATQIPDKSSVPPNITRCVTMRWCLAVQDQLANDMILGTGAYKRGQSATVYRPGHDAGWGIFTGLAEPTAVRSHFPSPEVAAAMVRRATQLRGGVIGNDEQWQAPRHDTLADVLRVFAHAGRPGLQWVTLAELLGEQLPETYAGLAPEVLSATLRDAGVPSVDVKVDGVNLKGCRRDAVDAAIRQREITAGE